MKQTVKPKNSNSTPTSSDSASKRRLRLGFVVFGALAFIKIAEYLVALTVRSGDWPYLLILALISAGLIIYFYKHIRDLWHREEI